MAVFICTVCDAICICSLDRDEYLANIQRTPRGCLLEQENEDPDNSPAKWEEVHPQIAELVLRGLVDIESVRVM